MTIRVRPKFKFLMPLKPNEIVERINSNTKNLTNEPIECKVFSTHGLFRIIEKQQHFWSPQLNVSFEETEDGTIVRGMYGPHPTVWAIILMVNALLGIAFFFIAIMGFTEMNLGHEAPILWFLPIIFIGLAATYISAQVGHQLGDKQTMELHHYFEKAIGKEFSLSH